MNRESFLETIRRQCSEDIVEAYQAAVHVDKDGHPNVDYEQLSKLLNRLMKNVAKEGITHLEFAELVYSNLPQASGRISLKPPVVVPVPVDARKVAA
jgi:hypothetical protein